MHQVIDNMYYSNYSIPKPSYAYEDGEEASDLCSWSSCQPSRLLPLPPPLPLLHLILGRRRAAVSIDHHHCDELLSVAGAQGEIDRHVRCDAYPNLGCVYM